MSVSLLTKGGLYQHTSPLRCPPDSECFNVALSRNHDQHNSALVKKP